MQACAEGKGLYVAGKETISANSNVSVEPGLGRHDYFAETLMR